MKTKMIISLFIFIFYSCNKNINVPEIKELESNKLIHENAALYNKDWILRVLINNSDNDIMVYPDGMDKAWLNFTKDSVYVNTFGGKEGSLYRILSNDSITIEPIPFWDSCFGRFKIYCMNVEIPCGLGFAYKYEINKNQLTIFTHGTFSFILVADQPISVENSIEFIEVDLDCINKASSGGSFTLRIDTQEEYDSLYYYKFTKILEDWLDNNYEALIQGVIRNYPNATPNEYDSILMNDFIYNFFPYRGVKDCTHPTIDFSKYTLLGKSISAGGCFHPTVEILTMMDRNKKELTYLTNVVTYGADACEMGFEFNKWILIDKLDADYKIIFESKVTNVTID